MLQPGSRYESKKVLAWGYSEVRLDEGVNGRFDIDLRKYLPPEPTEALRVYHVRVLPLEKIKVSKFRKQPVLQVGETKIPTPVGVGPWSLPFVIRYAKPGKKQWGETFTESRDIYQKVQFYLDSIEMVQDQYGPGAEEFHVAGFIQESFPKSSNKVGKRFKFGPYFAKLEPDVGASQNSYGEEARFNLNNPDQPEWPRSYTCVITVMEQDDGGGLADWESEFWTISDDMLLP